MIEGGQEPADRVAQGDIVIDIADEELEVVREHFGEVDELGELTLRGRRRDIIDNLREEAVLEDVSAEDEEEVEEVEEDETDETQETDEAATTDGGSTTDDAATSEERAAASNTTEVATSTEAGSSAPKTTTQDESAAASPDAESAEAPTAPPDATPKTGKKKRRRRRKKKTPFVPPELTAPPHKDFWEVWSTKYNATDFDDEKYPLPEPPPPPAPKPARPDDFAASAEDDGTYVRVALGLGRNQGYKSAGIRSFLAEHAALKGKAVRDLTVRANVSYFRLAEGQVEAVRESIGKAEVEGKPVEFRLTEAQGAPALRAEVSDALVADVVASLSETAAHDEEAPADKIQETEAAADSDSDGGALTPDEGATASDDQASRETSASGDTSGDAGDAKDTEDTADTADEPSESPEAEAPEVDPQPEGSDEDA